MLAERRDKMKIDVLTLFPAMFAGPLDESIIKRARDTGLLELKIHNLEQILLKTNPAMTRAERGMKARIKKVRLFFR